MWIREKHADWSFRLMVFFLSNETIFGKFYMGLGIVWVMKPREREREKEKCSQIREKKSFRLGKLQLVLELGHFS